MTGLTGAWVSGGVEGRGCGAGCAACWASAGSAIASAADAIRSGLMRIAGLRHVDLDRLRRPFLGKCREEEQHSDQEHDGDNQHGNSGHGGLLSMKGAAVLLPTD